MSKIERLNKKELWSVIRTKQDNEVSENDRNKIDSLMTKVADNGLDSTLKNVSKNDLIYLAEILSNNTSITIENSKKKPSVKLEPKKEEKKATIKLAPKESAKQEEPKKEQEEPKQKKNKVVTLAKKSTKEEPKKSVKTVTNSISKRDKLFPSTLNYKPVNSKLDTTVLNRKDFTDISDVVKFLKNNEDNSIYVALKWTPTEIKKYEYDPFKVSPIEITKFDSNLDLCEIIYCGANVVYAVSVNSDTCFAILENELVPSEEDDIKYTNGIEFDFYTL